jgi:hypothetical protein
VLGAELIHWGEWRTALHLSSSYVALLQYEHCKTEMYCNERSGASVTSVAEGAVVSKVIRTQNFIIINEQRNIMVTRERRPSGGYTLVP